MAAVEPQTWIRFTCPKCGKRFKVAKRLAGKKGCCSCGNHIRIPPAERPSSSVPVKVSLKTPSDRRGDSRRESRGQAVECMVAAVFAGLLAAYRAAQAGGVTVGVVLTFVIGWPLLYWSSRWSTRKWRKQKQNDGVTRNDGRRVQHAGTTASGRPAGDTRRRISRERPGLRKVGLLLGGAAILVGILWVVVLVRSHADEPNDDRVAVRGSREAAVEVEQAVDEPVEETIAAQNFERKPNAAAALWQEMASIPQLAMDRGLSGTSYIEIQRKCEQVLAASPELAEVRRVWEQVRFHQKCRQCRGRGAQTCELCNGRGTRPVPDGFTEKKLPVFTGVVPRTMQGFDYEGGSYFPGGSLAECNLWFSLYGATILVPSPFPDGLREATEYVQPADASLYQCRNCGYYDMPMLVRPFFSDGRRQTEFEAGRLKIRCPKTYVWTGRTGKKIFLRLQEDKGFGGSDADFKFMQPLETCPNCGRSEYIQREPRMREAACEHCGGSGETGACPACQGSAIERLSKARELSTIVSLENRLTTGSLHVDFVGESPGFIVITGGPAPMPARMHLFPGRYRMLLTCYGQQMQPTQNCAVSEEFEIRHHATYASEPVFVLAPAGQGNIKLTEVTKQELEQMKNQARTPVLLKNTLGPTPITVTLIGKLEHSSVRRTRTIPGGQDLRLYLSPGSYRALVKYDYRDEGRKPQYAKTREVEIGKRTSYNVEPVFDFSPKGSSNIELTSISEEAYMELNPHSDMGRETPGGPSGRWKSGGP